MSEPDGGQNPPQDPQSQGQQPQGPPPQDAQSQRPQRQGQEGRPAPEPSAPQAGASAPQPGAPAAGAAAGTAAPAGMTPEELKQKLSSVGLVNPLPSLAVGGATYVGGIVLSVLTIVLIAIAAAVASIGNPVEAALETADMDPSEALSGIGSAVRFPFQLVAMAMLGSLGFSKTIEGETISASVRLLPGVITVVMVLLSFYGGRFVQKRQAAGQIGIWISSVLTGFAVALFTVLAALIFAQPVPVYGDISLRLHAAGFDAFFGAFFLITLALALGRISVRARPAWWPLVTDLTAGFKLALSHALIVTVLGVVVLTVGTTISALIDGETPPMLIVLLLLPLLGGYLFSYVTGLDMLSALSVSTSGPELFGMMDGVYGNETASMFSMPWYAWLVGLLIGAIGLLLAALLWQHQRQVVPNNVVALGVSWVALPAAYFVGSLGLLLLARLSMTISYSGSFSDSEKMGVGVGLAAWTPLLALMAGMIVELLSRFVLPLVAPFIPAALLGWFRRPLAPALAAGTATAATAHAADTAPAGAEDPGAVNAEGIPTELPGGAPLGGDAAQNAAPQAAEDTSAYGTVPLGATGGALAVAGAAAAGGQAAEPTPLSPRARRLLIGGAVSVGSAFVIIIGVTVAFNVISSTVYSPEKKVEAYLSALQEGDASTALEISAPNVPTAQQALLTDAIAGAAEERISGYEIVDTEKGDDGAIVTAKLTQDGVTSTRTFSVERSGRTAVVFPQWTMQETEYAHLEILIPEGATSVLVNEQEVPVESLAPEDGYATAAVLPGAYTVSVPAASEMITAEPGEVYVPADPDDWYELYAAPSYVISEAGVAEAQKQVDALLDECATSTEARPEGCPFGTYAYNIVEDSGAWTIDTYPTIELEEGRDGWLLSSYDAPGEATFTYQSEGWDDEITDETEEGEFTVSGEVALAEDGSLEVELGTGYW